VRPAGKASILIAGDSHEAEELLWVVRPIMLAYDKIAKYEEDFDLRISQLLADLRKVVRRRLNEIVTHTLFMNYNIEFAQFVKDGPNMFSSDYYARILSEIRNIRLGCSFIVAYVEDTEPFLLEIAEDGKVRWHGEFVCIGTGGLLAWAMMSHGICLTSMSLIDCLSKVFFAKRMAERDPYDVGTTTSILVDVRGRDKYWLSDEGEKYLDENIKVIDAPTGLTFDPKFLEPFGPAKDENDNGDGEDKIRNNGGDTRTAEKSDESN